MRGCRRRDRRSATFASLRYLEGSRSFLCFVGVFGRVRRWRTFGASRRRVVRCVVLVSRRFRFWRVFVFRSRSWSCLLVVGRG